MNNEDQSKNNQTSASSEWAEIVDRLGQTPILEDSDGTEPVKPVDLTPERLDDLELDGQLKMLGKVSSPDDSFVSQVMAQTNSESSPGDLNRPRLPVIGPSLVTETSEAIEANSAVVAETSEVVANTPEAAVEPTEAVAETSLASSLDDGIDSPSLSQEVSRRRPVALLALLATILFVGFFIGSTWFGPAPEIVDFPVPNEGVAKTLKLEPIPDQVHDGQLDAPEISPETLVEQTTKKDSSDDSMAASVEKVDQQDRDNNDADSNPTLVDTKEKLDSAVVSTEDDLPEIGDEEDMKDRSVASSSSDGPSWDSQFDWNLALQFHRNGVGSISLNGEPIKAIVLQDNASFLLPRIAGEMRRRVRFLENRLGSKVSGSITVEDSKYSFDDLSELDQAVAKVDKHIGNMGIRELNVNELMSVRTGYRKEIFSKRNKFGSISLAHRNLRFYTEDEAFTICSVLASTEGVLQDLAKERLEWEEDNKLLLTKSKLKNCIEPKAFQHFANTGLLLPPDPKFTGQSVASIQNLGPSELRRMLQDAPSVELFRNAAEFQQAKDFVYSNGSPTMKVRLSIDKVDRFLERPMTEDAERILRDEKRSLVAELRRTILLQGGRQVRDGAPMEPLRDVLAKRTDLQGLPFVMGKECMSDAKETRDLKQVSFSVGRTIGQFNGSLGSRDNAQNDAFRNLAIKEAVSYCMKDDADNSSAQKLKTIDQILQIDHPRLRLGMIGALRKSGTNAAVELMVNKAKFDLEPEVRIAATDALADMEPGNIRGLLLDGLKYPWHVVAEHSAEALVRLDDQEAVPQLIEMLDLPHPHLPFQDNDILVQHELVGINHMRNYLLCHSPSTSSSDSVRGLIPHTSRPLPRSYYEPPGESAVPFTVRADVTYLEQDFSVVQPVKDSAPWPAEQRFDYVVQKKRLTPAEAEKVARQISQSPNRNWNAIVFALQELTGEKPADNSSRNWKLITSGRE